MGGMCTCGTAIAMCPMGAAPMPLTFLPSPMTFGSAGPIGNIMDMAPFLNVSPFAICMSMANPVTAALTAAAFGVLTPGPCIPTPGGPWLPLAPTVLETPGPILISTSKLICSFGGVIQIIMPAQFTVLA